MDKIFDTNIFLNHLAQELIANFAIAGSATTPGLVGGAREKAVRDKLSSLLTKSVGVGSGCVIDSYGNTSKQIDIIIYEKDLCPVFAINDNPESTYYPCEGVIAIGEVKSSLNGKELDDIFQKILSVKKLIRFAKPSKSQMTGDLVTTFRKFGSTTSWDCAQVEEFNQNTKRTDQIFGFAFCGELDIRPDTLADKYKDLVNSIENHLAPNLISILNYGLVLYMNRSQNAIRYWPGDDSDTIFVSPKRDLNFQFLIARLMEFIQIARTVDYSAYNRYIAPSAGDVFLNGEFRTLK